MNISDLNSSYKKWLVWIQNRSNHLSLLAVIGGFSLGFFSFFIGIYALLASKSIKPASAAVSNPVIPQVLAAESQNQTMVDVSGAVEHPGVYAFTSGERIDDAIKKAGGLQKKADTIFLSKNLNLAAKLKDEEKIYIPFIGDKSQPAVQSTAHISAAITHNSDSVNVNAASLNDLMELEGIGEVRAQKIISNRPYSSLEELVDKDVLTSKIFANIKNQLSI